MKAKSKQLKAEEFAIRYNKFVMNEKRIYQKVFNSFMQICFDNNIPVSIFKNATELTNHLFPEYAYLKSKKDVEVAGVFVWTREDDKFAMANEIGLAVTSKTNELQLNKTFAHELGHYFCVKESMDRSEESADKTGIELFKQVLTEIEFHIIESSVKIWLGTSFYYDKNKKEEGKEYRDMSKSIEKEFEYKRQLKEKAISYYKEKYKKKSILTKLKEFFS